MLSFLFALLSICSISTADFIELQTSLGRIIGNIETPSTNSTVYSFKGIQYGIPPIGSKRFRPSILNDSWPNSTYNATTYGKLCIQPNKDPSTMSEDCLNLNIWTPSISPSSSYPVMFWIHGGGLKSGSGTYAVYNGTSFVDIAQNIIIVTIDYRLGPLGFLASMQLYNQDPTNYPSTGGLNGLGDQILALTWIKKYISDFGGNPNEITIFGESAGGNSVCMLSVSSHPEIVSNTLFSKAISQSCSCTGPWGPLTTSNGLLENTKQLKNNNLPTDINELRKLPATDFNLTTWSHSIDGVILTDLPFILYANISSTNNVFHPNKLIMGFNSVDGTSEQKNHPVNAAQYDEYIRQYITNDTQVQLIETVYYPLSEYESFKGYPAASIAWFSMNGDVCVACPTFEQMDMINNQLMGNDTQYVGYMYEFAGTGPPNYAKHGADVDFVFDYPTTEEEKFGVKWNQTLSNVMIENWSAFGKYGIPSEQWKSYNVKQGNVIIFDDNVRVMENYKLMFRHGACPFWYNEVGIDTLTHLCQQR